MPSARAIVAKDEPKGAPKKVFKRGGAPSDTERDFVAQYLQDQPTEVTKAQVTSLAKVLRRSPAAIRSIIEDARDEFAASAGMYVNIHKQAATGALESGDFEVAMKGAQWYMEHVGLEGVQIVQKQAAQVQGNKIMIGIRIGGVDAAKDIQMPEITAEAVPIE
jgi:hypothetical protein